VSEAVGLEHAGDGPLAIDRFDRVVDEWLERWRGNPVADKVFVTASELGDFSLIWHIIGAARGTVSNRNADQSLLFAALLGVESLVVNQGLKRLFNRRRPTVAGDPRFPVRRPTTSSFPSGHSSAAFFAATVLTSRDGVRAAPIWFGLAGIVATSRAFVRIHHPSDVAAGAVVGAALGQGALALLRAVRAR
jgi:membrane-associated phospholipid phosphatase